MSFSNVKGRCGLLEKLILCVIVAGYAVLVDLQAAILRSSALSIHDFQVLPLTIWAAIMSVLAVFYVFFTFRSELKREIRKRRQTVRNPAAGRKAEKR